MSKTIKIISILMIAIMLCTVSTRVFATGEGKKEIDVEAVLTDVKTGIAEANVTNSTKDLASRAGIVIRLIRNVAIILAVVLISVLGIKYMLGSAEEKSGYQKSFVPLIIGIIVVVLATQIATMLFGVAG